MLELLITFVNLTGIIWLRYFMIAGVFYYMLWGRPAEKVGARCLTPKRPDRAKVFHEIRLSLASSVVYAFPAAVTLEAWKAGGTAIYTDINGILGWLYIPISILIYLIIQDGYFYWTHRAMHHPKLYHWMHAGHHKSKQPTPWAAFSFDLPEALISAWLLPVAAFFIPIHIGAALAVLTIMTMCSVVNHAGWEVYPKSWTDGFMGRHFITASHHNRHHTKYTTNYGLFFRFWDRVMGTDGGLSQEVEAKARS